MSCCWPAGALVIAWASAMPRPGLTRNGAIDWAVAIGDLRAFRSSRRAACPATTESVDREVQQGVQVAGVTGLDQGDRRGGGQVSAGRRSAGRRRGRSPCRCSRRSATVGRERQRVGLSQVDETRVGEGVAPPSCDSTRNATWSFSCLRIERNSWRSSPDRGRQDVLIRGRAPPSATTTRPPRPPPPPPSRPPTAE